MGEGGTNGGEAQGRLLLTVELHTKQIDRLDTDLDLLKKDSSSVQALFHRIDEKTELEFENLKWSLRSHKSSMVKDIIFMIGTAIFVIAYVSSHMPR